jgi:hypothetical protein
LLKNPDAWEYATYDDATEAQMPIAFAPVIAVGT